LISAATGSGQSIFRLMSDQHSARVVDVRYFGRSLLEPASRLAAQILPGKQARSGSGVSPPA
jgi:hypothetical protein